MMSRSAHSWQNIDKWYYYYIYDISILCYIDIFWQYFLFLALKQPIANVLGKLPFWLLIKKTGCVVWQFVFSSGNGYTCFDIKCIIDQSIKINEVMSPFLSVATI